VHTNCYIFLNLIIIDFFFKLINNNVNPALLLSGNLLFRQNFLTSELFIIPIHVSVRKKYIVIRKRLIRNLVLIRNNFNRIHNFSHIYLWIFLHFNSDKRKYTHIYAAKVPSFLVTFYHQLFIMCKSEKLFLRKRYCVHKREVVFTKTRLCALAV
jgi:hypothetical protein